MNTMNCSPRRMHKGSHFGSWPMYFEDLMKGKDMATNVPAVNIIANENDWQIEVSAPGFTKENFKVNLEKDVLTVSAEYKTESDNTEKNYSRREFSCASFSRTFRVQESNVDIEKITAGYENGILTITLPKIGIEAKKSVNINIQ